MSNQLYTHGRMEFLVRNLVTRIDNRITSQIADASCYIDVNVETAAGTEAKVATAPTGTGTHPRTGVVYRFNFEQGQTATGALTMALNGAVAAPMWAQGNHNARVFHTVGTGVAATMLAIWNGTQYIVLNPTVSEGWRAAHNIDLRREHSDLVWVNETGAELGADANRTRLSFQRNGTSNVGLKLTETGVTAGTFGGTSATTGAIGAAFVIPHFTVDASGRITAAGTRNHTVTLPNVGPGANTHINGQNNDAVSVNIGASFNVPRFTLDAQGRVSAAGVRATTVNFPTVPGVDGDHGGAANNTAASVPINTAFAVPRFTVDDTGRVTAAGTRNVTITLPNAGPGVGGNGTNVNTVLNLAWGTTTTDTIVSHVATDAQGRVTARNARAIHLPSLPAANATTAGVMQLHNTLGTSTTVAVTQNVVNNVNTLADTAHGLANTANGTANSVRNMVVNQQADRLGLFVQGTTGNPAVGAPGQIANFAVVTEAEITTMLNGIISA